MSEEENKVDEKPTEEEKEKSHPMVFIIAIVLIIVVAKNVYPVLVQHHFGATSVLNQSTDKELFDYDIFEQEK